MGRRGRPSPSQDQEMQITWVLLLFQIRSSRLMELQMLASFLQMLKSDPEERCTTEYLHARLSLQSRIASLFSLCCQENVETVGGEERRPIFPHDGYCLVSDRFCCPWFGGFGFLEMYLFFSFSILKIFCCGFSWFSFIFAFFIYHFFSFQICGSYLPFL